MLPSVKQFFMALVNITINECNCKKRKEHEHVTLVLIQSIQKSKFIIMSLSLTIGTPEDGLLQLVDSATLAVHSEATFANITATSSDPSLTASVDASTPNQIDITPNTVGSGNLQVIADATYTDSNTNQSVTKTGLQYIVPFTIVAGSEDVQLVVNFGPVAPAPAPTV